MMTLQETGGDGMIAILGPLHGWGTVILAGMLITLLVLLLMHWLGPRRG